MVEFNRVEVLWLLGMLPLVVGWMIWRVRLRSRQLERAGDVALLSRLVRGQHRTRRYVRITLWSVALMALVFAWAGPTWGFQRDIVQERGIGLVLVLDVSASMDAQDVLPSRLERAKLDVQTLIREGGPKQVGLILFAGSAFVQVPLTGDLETAITFVKAASSTSLTRQGTALADALTLALDTLDERLVSSAAVVVLSDGENHEGDPSIPAQIAADRGIVIHAIGYGSEDGASIPLIDADGQTTGYKVDAQGRLVLTQLNESALREVVTTTGGVYRRATDSGVEVLDIFNRLEDLQQEEYAIDSGLRRVERYELFVIIALVALTLEMGGFGGKA